MAMNYYRAYLANESRLHLDDDNFLGDDFVANPDIRVDQPVKYSLETKNLEQDFIDVSSAFLVSTKLFEILVKLTNNYKTYPAIITKNDGTVIEDYRIFFIGDEIPCFNWDKSVYDERNEELNMPEFLRTIVLDKQKLPEFQDKNIFRLNEMNSAIIINDYAKRILEEAKVTGFIFEELAVE